MWAGFVTLALFILVGGIMGRIRLLDENGADALGALGFYVAVPALLLRSVSESNLSEVLGDSLIVVGAAAIVAGFSYFVAAVTILKRRSALDLTIGSLSASLVNASVVALPMSVLVFGDPTPAVSVIIIQLVVFTPLFTIVLDRVGYRTAVSNRSYSVLWQVIRSVGTNPAVLAVLLGVWLSSAGLSLPELIAAPVGVLADAASPIVLIALGVSLGQVGALRSSREVSWGAVGWAIAARHIVYPGAITLLSGWATDWALAEMFPYLAVAAAPAAQNAFLLALVYRGRASEVRNTIMISLPVSLLSYVLIVGVASWLSL